MQNKSRKLKSACVVLATIAGGHSVTSAELVLPAEIYPYSVVLQDLPVVLREFGQNIGIRVEISATVKGSVRGRLPRLPAKEFLDYLCHVYGLESYFDGYTLYISSSSEGATRVFPLGKFRSDQLTENLLKMSITDSRFPLRFGPDGRSAIVSGPPRYIALVEQTLASLTRPESIPLLPVEQPKKIVIYRGANMSVVEFGSGDKTN
ncbi:MAG: nodulation protein NolW [Hyphomicrobiales bacterium]|nr:nodulation protein NolW [Hyphomicrobiales bacterium]